MSNKLSPEFLEAFGKVSKKLSSRSHVDTSEKAVLESRLASVQYKINSALKTGVLGMKELNEERNKLIQQLALVTDTPVAEIKEEVELAEAKMEDSEVLAAAKRLAANAKDEKTKKFGQGLVDFYKKNNSFTPDQVSGLQNIMKNASFQMAKEEVELEEASQPQWEIDIKGVGRASVKAANEKQAIKRAAKQLRTTADYTMGVKRKDVKVTKLSEEVELEEARAIDMKAVEALGKIKDSGELKKKAIEIINGSGANARKKASLENSIKNASTNDKVLGIVWNAVLAGDGMSTVGSKWGKNMKEEVELEEAKKVGDTVKYEKGGKMMSAKITDVEKKNGDYRYALSNAGFVYHSDLEESVDLNESKVSHDRYKRSHMKNASPTTSGLWMFTNKSSGSPNWNNEDEVFEFNGKGSEAFKAAKEWGKKHGHSNVYVMEEKQDDGEGLDPVKKKALKKDFDDRKDKDIDNDGDSDDSDEYLHKRRQAVSKAIKEAVQLDELSRKTLASYTNKAARDMSRKRSQADNSKSTNKERDKAVDKMINRKRGIKQATDRLAKD